MYWYHYTCTYQYLSAFINLYTHTLEILWVWLQATTIKQVSPQSESHDFFSPSAYKLCLPGATSEESACQFRRPKRDGFNPWVRRIPQRKKWQPAAVFLPGELHGHGSPVGYRLWGHKELDMTDCSNKHRYCGLGSTQQHYV